MAAFLQDGDGLLAGVTLRGRAASSCFSRGAPLAALTAQHDGEGGAHDADEGRVDGLAVEVHLQVIRGGHVGAEIPRWGGTKKDRGQLWRDWRACDGG